MAGWSRRGGAPERPSGARLSMGRSADKETRVERAEEVPELDGAAEDRDRAGRAARRPQREGRLPGARDLGHALLLLARQAAGGWPRGAGGQGGADGRAGAASEDPRAGAGAGSQDLRARDRGGKHCEAGSEDARRPVSRAGRARLRRRGRGARDADQPAGALPDADAQAAAAAAAAGRPDRADDHRGRQGKPDRWLPHGCGANATEARSRDQPQARAARDAGAEVDPGSGS
jgi:hypothetical protein